MYVCIYIQVCIHKYTLLNYIYVHIYVNMYNFKVVILLPWFYIEELNLCQLSIRNYQLLKKLFIMENFKHRQKQRE